MVEHIEICGAHIELEPFGQVETPTQREIGLIDAVRTPEQESGQARDDSSQLHQCATEPDAFHSLLWRKEGYPGGLARRKQGHPVKRDSSQTAARHR